MAAPSISRSPEQAPWSICPKTHVAGLSGSSKTGALHQSAPVKPHFDILASHTMAGTLLWKSTPMGVVPTSGSRMRNGVGSPGSPRMFQVSCKLGILTILEFVFPQMVSFGDYLMEGEKRNPSQERTKLLVPN